MRFNERSDSNEGIVVHGIHGSGIHLRRLPSWNSYLTEIPAGKPIRGSESDSSLLTTRLINTNVSVSPGKNQVFRISPEQHLSGGGSPDSDISSDFGSRTHYLMPMPQENYLQNEMKFVSQEIGKVRDQLNDKV